VFFLLTLPFLDCSDQWAIKNDDAACDISGLWVTWLTKIGVTVCSSGVCKTMDG